MKIKLKLYDGLIAYTEIMAALHKSTRFEWLCQAAMKRKATPLLEYRLPVGAGPSLNT